MGFIKDSSSHAVLSSLGIYNSADTTRDNTRAVFWHPEAHRTEVVEYDGPLKFNALLEWLQSHIDGKQAGRSEQAKPKTNDDHASAGKNADSSAADAKARRQAKLDEAERRDQARRQKAAEGATRASKVEDAPKAVPEDGVEESQVTNDQTGGGAADPVPEMEAMEGNSAQEAQETIMHEEL